MKTKKKLRLITCPFCNGSGLEKGTSIPIPCCTCKGRKKIWVEPKKFYKLFKENE